jgi:hypothetical protein
MNTKISVVYRLIGIITLATKNKLQILKQNNYMRADLKRRIKEFNNIKFNGNNDKRIIIATLKPGLTIAPSNNK